MIDRDFAAAKRALDSAKIEEIAYTNSGMSPKGFLEGCTFLAQGDRENAQRRFSATLPYFEKAVQDAPDSADRHANLGLAYAFMRRNEDAIREGKRAVELKPESVDAYDGVGMRCYLALIYTWAGEKARAISELEYLIKTPGAVDSLDSSITINDLKRRWEWDPVRNEPGFQKIIRGDGQQAR
jgi:tetratricopeptide (TPR) repeat protein